MPKRVLKNCINILIIGIFTVTAIGAFNSIRVTTELSVDYRLAVLVLLSLLTNLLSGYRLSLIANELNAPCRLWQNIAIFNRTTLLNMLPAPAGSIYLTLKFAEKSSLRKSININVYVYIVWLLTSVIAFQLTLLSDNEVSSRFVAVSSIFYLFLLQYAAKAAKISGNLTLGFIILQIALTSILLLRLALISYFLEEEFNLSSLGLVLVSTSALAAVGFLNSAGISESIIGFAYELVQASFSVGFLLMAINRAGSLIAIGIFELIFKIMSYRRRKSI